LKFGDGSLVYAADFFPLLDILVQGLLQQRKCLIVLDPAKLRFEVEQGGRQPALLRIAVAPVVHFLYPRLPLVPLAALQDRGRPEDLLDGRMQALRTIRDDE
jgi:hypothetical protein